MVTATLASNQRFLDPANAGTFTDAALPPGAVATFEEASYSCFCDCPYQPVTCVVSLVVPKVLEEGKALPILSGIPAVGIMMFSILVHTCFATPQPTPPPPALPATVTTASTIAQATTISFVAVVLMNVMFIMLLRWSAAVTAVAAGTAIGIASTPSGASFAAPLLLFLSGICIANTAIVLSFVNSFVIILICVMPIAAASLTTGIWTVLGRDCVSCREFMNSRFMCCTPLRQPSQ